MEDQKRNPGYYWVKYMDEWMIAVWNKEQLGMGHWKIAGIDSVFLDFELSEIDEKQIIRENFDKECDNVAANIKKWAGEPHVFQIVNPKPEAPDKKWSENN